MNGMRKLLLILMVLPFTLNVRTENPPSMLEKAVSNIKRWEGWHRGKMPYIGYGHRLLPHEKLTENLSEAQADSLLRCDLERCLKVFRKYGKDSLLLSLLGFNVGCLPSDWKREDTQKQTDSKTGKWRSGYLQGIYIVPLLSGESHSKHREEKKRGV